MRIVFIFLTLVSFVFAQNPQKTDTKKTQIKQEVKSTKLNKPNKEEQAKRDALIKQMQEKAKLELERQKQEAELAKQKAIKEEQEAKKRASYRQAREELESIDKEIENNIYITRYNNYLTYRKIEAELTKIKADAKKYSRWKGKKYKELSYQLFNKVKIKENELELISEYKDSPIGKQITPITIVKAPKITNPFILIEAFSYIQNLKENQTAYEEVNTQLVEITSVLNQKLSYFKDLKFAMLKNENKINFNSNEFKEELEKILEHIDDNWEIIRDYVAIYAIDKYMVSNYAKKQNQGDKK